MYKLFVPIFGAAIMFATTAPAFAENTPAIQAIPLQISQIGDVELSCGALSEEALTMRAIVNATQEIKDESTMQSQGISAVGAVGSLIIGSATGGIGLAAAGFLLDQNVGSKSDEAETVQDIAQQRRSLMVGIYNAKGCFGPVEHAMLDNDAQNTLSLASVEPASGTENKPVPSRYNN